MRKFLISGFAFVICVLSFAALVLAQDPEREYGAQDLRDPFYNQEYYAQPQAEEPVFSVPEAPSGPAQPLPQLSVQGLIWDTAVPQAIVNNKVVKKGDIVQGARITDISKEGVKVVFSNREYNLSVAKSVPLSGREAENE